MTECNNEIGVVIGGIVLKLKCDQYEGHPHRHTWRANVSNKNGRTITRVEWD